MSRTACSSWSSAVSVRRFRPLHAAAAVVMLSVLTWALLSVNPFRAVRTTPLHIVRTLNDFVVHLTAYAAVTIVWGSLPYRTNDSVRRRLTGLLAVHAVTTELLQAFIPRRHCDPTDLTANLLGIVLGLCIVNAWPRVDVVKSR